MATCEALGGQLASLESQEEFMFARTIAFTLSFHQPDEFSGDYRIVCTMDPPTLNNAKRGIRLMGLLSHT
ncbi:hypothetical protein TCAL_15733 [Tigriopus californicus]|uniref:Uncharacterized protein n=1 Tax=Tigriopus californicus TaxID=6832 RepID=A0A553P6P1_TIGCA|nr:hypothetical protein TCAL_15733 [Tigriopus californicus]